MSGPWLFDELPLEVEQIIQKWVVEFHRVDAIERYKQHLLHYKPYMAVICEDIRLNVPYYTFGILFPNDRCLTISLFACEMNPVKTASDVLRMPTSLITYRRRALSLPRSQRFYHDRYTIQQLASL